MRRAPALLLALTCCFGSATGAVQPGSTTPSSENTHASVTCTNILSFSATSPLIIEWRAGSLKRLEVTSNDNKARMLGVQMSDLELLDSEGKRVEIADVIKVLPPSLPLNAVQGGVITIEVIQTPAVKPGVYVGSLTFALDSETYPKGCLARLAVQLTVLDAEPMTDKATIRYYRLWPFPLFDPASFKDDLTIPLRGAVTSLTTSTARDAPLGIVQNERGHTARVYRANEPAVSKDGVIALPLEVRGHTQAGVYEGQLRLNTSGDKAGSLKLFVVVTDIFVWPVIVIALSILLALWMQRYINVVRALWRLLGQEAELGVAFRESQSRFAEAASGTTFATYSIAADLAQRRKALREKIGALQASSTLTLNTADERYKAVVEEVETLRKDIAAWGVFGNELTALQDALAANPHMGDPPPNYEGDKPALFIRYRELLDGETLTLAQFAERRQQVQKAAQVVGDWYELKQSIDEGENRYEKLKLFAGQMSEGELAQLAGALKDLKVGRLAIWEAEDAVELAAVSAQFGTLAAAKKSLLELAAVYSGQPATGGGVTTPHELVAGAKPEMLVNAFGSVAGDEPQEDAERVRYYDEAAEKWDRRMAWLAFAIATLTLLHSNYLGKAFGSLKDYVSLLIMGLGTKLLVDASSVVLGRFFGAGRVTLRGRG